MKLGQKVFISKSEGQTRAFAAEFAESLEKGGVIALYGDLGAGKTTFVQGLAKGLGIQKRIISPTFVIMRMYEINNRQQTADVILVSEAHPESLRQVFDSEVVQTRGAQGKTDPGQARMTENKGQTIKTLYHIDLYRLEERKQVQELGLKELMESPENLVVIEWAEKLGKMIPEKRFDITFNVIGENRRKISVDRF